MSSLALSSLHLVNFRSYRDFTLEGLGNLSIMVGPNAVGKTNAIEAIQLVTAIHSFRNPRIEHLLHDGCDYARVEARLEGEDRQLDVGLLLSPGKKKYLLNGKPRQASSLKGMCPAVIFTPDDLDLVKGSNSGRRDALDNVGSQVSENQRIVRRDFTQVLKNKNALLKDEAREDLIRASNEVFIICSAQMTCYRRALFKRMEPYIRAAYETISGSHETLTCEYVPSWTEQGFAFEGDFSRDEARDLTAMALDKAFAQECQRHRSIVGAHADKINFAIDGRDASIFASQGQQRSLVLAFKIAEVSAVREILGMQPVLLLDDVMSELDAQRREALVDFIEDEMQVFITTTNLGYFEPSLVERARVIELNSDNKE